jgi:hypothetical protein
MKELKTTSEEAALGEVAHQKPDSRLKVHNLEVHNREY